MEKQILNGVNTYKGGKRNRRIRALKRLEHQLVTGFKPGERPVRGIDIPLDESDIKRINSEITILKAKI